MTSYHPDFSFSEKLPANPFFVNVYDSGLGMDGFGDRDEAHRFRSRRHKLLYRIRVIPKPPLDLQTVKDCVRSWLNTFTGHRRGERSVWVHCVLDRFCAANVSMLEPHQFRPFLRELGLEP
ncbi:hypothetical protein [Mesorhizobium sp.]|uniref:hypothetical protein n=1 Tax=Mesorhizobium sp. TaxID=1871066 RepID=UPI000FE9D633|nr:hypothetical protein [Mesorhizobium sp.]RWE37445.1 MAG: hypothetical protein EOS77_02375 [Mesorhizobium sp.]